MSADLGEVVAKFYTSYVKYFLPWSFSLVQFDMTSCVKGASCGEESRDPYLTELLECLDSAYEELEVLCNNSLNNILSGSWFKQLQPSFF